MTDITDAIKLIEDAVQDPKLGLGDEIFFMVSRLTPMTNVDLWIKNSNNATLLSWRDDEFHGPGWHLPGGILRYKETFAERIAAVAWIELGASVTFNEIPCMIRPIMNQTRNTRGHFISLLFKCEFLTPPDGERAFKGADPLPGEWAWHENKPDNLIPEHALQYGSIFER
ncbi:MAG: NUDIX hydrolase [Rhodospirillales bacterium]|nr:NUDIX hydrolase [Rhodospirillales bacterium]